jgi:hypothetical protein
VENQVLGEEDLNQLKSLFKPERLDKNGKIKPTFIYKNLKDPYSNILINNLK